MPLLSSVTTITGPTWVYHRTLAPRLIETQVALEALGDGWADTPAAFYGAPVAETPTVMPPLVADVSADVTKRRGRPRKEESVP